MDYAEYQQKFEEDADKKYQVYVQLSEDELLRLIRTQQYDDTYQIWRALQVKGTRKSVNVLYSIVSNLNNPYLIRYHACEALFKIARINNNEFKGMVQYGRDKYGKTAHQGLAIQQLKKLLPI